MNRKALPIICMAGLMAAPVYAAEAELVATKGVVSVFDRATKKWTRGKPGMKVNTRDRVWTGKKSVAHLTMKSGTTVLLKEKTRMTIRRDRKGSYLGVKLGEFLIGLKKSIRKEKRNLRVWTPTAVASVRGTVFWGKADAEESVYACFKGSIEVRGEGESVLLEPGQTTTISLNQAPTSPVAHSIPGDYVNNFAIDDSLQNIPDVLAEQ